jgi:hypothetical protein
MPRETDHQHGDLHGAALNRFKIVLARRKTLPPLRRLRRLICGLIRNLHSAPILDVSLNQTGLVSDFEFGAQGVGVLACVKFDANSNPDRYFT